MGCKIKLQQKRAKNNAGESGKNHPIRSSLIKRYFIDKKHGHPFMYTLVKFYGKKLTSDFKILSAKVRSL